MIRVKIMPNDTKTVAKIILVNSKNMVLMLKRSSYVEKYAGEWDLPGGHLKKNENLITGLTREVKEETSLTIRDPKFFKQLENIHFFKANYDSQEVSLSHEHVDYKFLDKNELDLKEKFQKVAFEVLTQETHNDQN